MDIKAARKVSVFNRVQSGGQYVKNQVCLYWLEGRCNRNPCRFMHRVSPPSKTKEVSQLVPADNNQPKSTWRNSISYVLKNGTVPTILGGKRSVQCGQQKILTTGGASTGDLSPQKVTTRGALTGDLSPQKVQPKLCQYWLLGNCVNGDKCKYLHSWFDGSGFSMLTILDGHSKTVTGISLPSGSDKLYSASKDESVRVWDCHSGQCIGAVKLGSEVGSLISEGSWVFVGLQNAVKAWNLQTQNELILDGPVGQVCAMVVGNNTLYAGVEGGSILAWKFFSDGCSPELAGSVNGHSDDVVSLVVGANNKLYSGSKDNTIKVWDLENMQCLQTIHGHCSAVTSLLCWDSFLLSGSLDKTLKVWGATESGNLEVVYEHREESGILALCGIYDAEAKPILLCSCEDSCVRLYDFPRLVARGRIFAKGDIYSIEIGCGGLFFTGDETGRVFVWKLDEARG